MKCHASPTVRQPKRSRGASPAGASATRDARSAPGRYASADVVYGSGRAEIGESPLTAPHQIPFRYVPFGL